jgi:hypothetical protein
MPQRHSPLPRSLVELLATVVAVVALLAATVSVASSSQPERVTPLAQAHAHNDYEQGRPLLDALEQGFTSVEADVWLMGGELLVAHDRDDVVPGATLETLYLEPLAERVRANGGRVHPGWDHSFQLLIDVKSDAERTYAALDKLLRRYDGMMTMFSRHGVEKGAVTATISGNRDRDRMARQTVRFAAYDGRLSDLGSEAPASLVPLISDSWTETFTWQGEGPMPRSERRRLHHLVAEAHADGRRVRFWATSDLAAPAQRRVWRAALDAGVDYLESDHLTDLRRLLLDEDATPSRPLVG